jgi:hypothetical protein
MEIFFLFYIVSALIMAMFFAINSKELMLRYLNNKEMYTKGLVMSVFIPIVNTVFAVLALSGLMTQGYYALKNKFS